VDDVALNPSVKKTSLKPSAFTKFFLSLPPEKEKFSFLNISHKVQKVLKCLRHQQGVTKNKLYNAKG